VFSCSRVLGRVSPKFFRDFNLRIDNLRQHQGRGHCTLAMFKPFKTPLLKKPSTTQSSTPKSSSTNEPPPKRKRVSDEGTIAATVRSRDDNRLPEKSTDSSSQKSKFFPRSSLGPRKPLLTVKNPESVSNNQGGVEAYYNVLWYAGAPWVFFWC
jgi:hypothetical protein